MNYLDQQVYKIQKIKMVVKIHFNNILISKIKFKDLKVRTSKTMVHLVVK